MKIEFDAPDEIVEMPIEGRLEVYRRDDGSVGLRQERRNPLEDALRDPEEQDYREADQVALMGTARREAFPIPDGPMPRGEWDRTRDDRSDTDYLVYFMKIESRRACAVWMRENAPDQVVLQRLAQRRGTDDATARHPVAPSPTRSMDATRFDPQDAEFPVLGMAQTEGSTAETKAAAVPFERERSLIGDLGDADLDERVCRLIWGGGPLNLHGMTPGEAQLIAERGQVLLRDHGRPFLNADDFIDVMEQIASGRPGDRSAQEVVDRLLRRQGQPQKYGTIVLERF